MSEDNVKRRISVLSWGFWGVFSAYKSAEHLQTAVNQSSGYICLMTLYLLFCVSCFFSASMVASVGPHKIIWVCCLPYVAITASYVFPSNGAVLGASCLAVGVAGANLWTAQGSYVGRCSQQMAIASGKPLSDCASILNADFMAVLSSAGGVSSGFAALTLSAFPDAIYPLFTVLTLIASFGTLLLMFLPPAGASDFELFSGGTGMGALLRPGNFARSQGSSGEECGVVNSKEVKGLGTKAMSSLGRDRIRIEVSLDEAEGNEKILSSGYRRSDELHDLPEHAELSVKERAEAVKGRSTTQAEQTKHSEPQLHSEMEEVPTVGFLARFLTSNEKLRYLIPIIFVQGLRMGFIIGPFYGQFVAKQIGLWGIPALGVMWSLISVLASLAWKIVVLRPDFGRRGAFFVGTIVQVAFLVIFGLWHSGNKQVGTFGVYVMAGVSCLINATLEPVWFGFLKATLQSMFTDSKELPCAMSSYFIVGCLGTATQQAVGVLLGNDLATQCLELAIGFVLAGASLAHLNSSIALIDPGQDLSLAAKG